MEVDSSLWTGLGFKGFPLMSEHAEYHKAEAEHERDYRLRIKKYRLVRASAILLALTLAVAGIAAWYARLAYIAARDEVKVAEDSLKEIKDSTRKELRAYVFAKPYPFINEVRAYANTHTRLNFRNSGQTPAWESELRASVVLKTDPPHPSLEVFQNTRVYMIESTLDPKTEINIGPELRPVKNTTPTDVAAIRHKTQAYFVWGTFLYKDVFEESKHHTYFCFIYTGLENTPDFATPKSAARLQGTCKTPLSD